MPLLTAEDYTQFPPVAPDDAYAYGDHPQQFGELYLPPTRAQHPVIVLIHGGCYQAAYNLKPISSLAKALADQGFAVWNIEYRRQDTGGGYPRMFLDVAQATDYLRQISALHPLNLAQVISVGHSAGGHLALWLAARHKLPASSRLHTAAALPIHGVVALAAVASPTLALEQGLCSEALPVVMGGTPAAVPAHYQHGSPQALLPLGRPQTHIVGSEDATMLNNVRAYMAAAQALGDEAELIILPEVGHFEIVSTASPAWQTVQSAIIALSAKLAR